MSGDLTHLSLFSGIGGIDLAAEWAGFTNICFVEIDKFCQKVLRKHWPDVPIIEDIHDVTKEKVMAYATKSESSVDRIVVGNSQQGEFRRNGSERIMGGCQRNASERHRQGIGQLARVLPITLITGGFPCQPVSVAGKRRGKEDDRWLWPEMFRVISEVRPAWVVAENVAGLARMGLNDCLSDLEGEGFEVTTFLIPACAVNALHRRDRIFIVAWNTNSRDWNEGAKCRMGKGQDPQPTGICEDVAHADDTEATRQRGYSRSVCGVTESAGFNDCCGEDWWAVEPDVGRVAHGIPRRVDRLRALGNAVVPQQIYPILKAIAELEMTR